MRDVWRKGTVGRVRTPHKSDGNYSAAARVAKECPPDAEDVEVELLEDFYCLEAGEMITTQRHLFTPEGKHG